MNNKTSRASAIPVIDWDACLTRYANNKVAINELLTMFCADLKNAQATIAKAYADSDTQTLTAELHRCLGGVCYLKLPQLENALNLFQQSLSQDSATSALAYQALNEAMDAFWAAMAAQDLVVD